MAPNINREEEEDSTIPSEVLFAPAPPAPAPAPARMPDINQNRLVPLTPDQESEQRFPPGCPVWHSLEHSTSSSFSSTTSNRHLPTMEGCGGVVRAIYIDLKSREIVYRVESNMSSSLTDDEAGGQNFILEGQLAFASDCPVKARGMLVEDDIMDDAGLEGVILCPHFPPPPLNDRNSSERKKLLYAIRFLLNGGGTPRVMVKFDVEQDLIVYNPSLSLDSGGETAGSSSRKEEENRIPGEEKERTKMNDLVSDHLMIDASFDNGIEETLAVQVQERSLTMACAVIDPDPIDGGSIFSSQFIQQSNATSEIASTAAVTEESDHQHHAVNDTKYEKRSDSSGSSLSVSPPARPCSTVDNNALAPYGDQEEYFSPRWEQPDRRMTLSSEIPQKQNLSSTVNEGQNNEFACVLTVPLWVLKKCVKWDDLFVHLIGEENGIRGHKVHEIFCRTNAYIHISGHCRDQVVPMLITIKSKDNQNSATRARRLIMKSLLLFLADPSLERRLVYEMEMTARGTFHIQRADGAVKAECHITHNLVWMKLLKFESRGMKLLLTDCLRRELTKDTDCHIEVYGLQDNTPTTSVPYAFIYGNVSDEVNNVSANVARLIKQHQQREDFLHNALGARGGSGTIFIDAADNGDGGKRGFQRPDPPMKRIVEERLASLIPGLGTTSTKRPRTLDGGGEDEVMAFKKILIPSDRNPGYNYVGLLIGPGGSKQRELIARSGGDVRISIRGQGCVGKSPIIPEKPPYVLLGGRKSNVDRAERLVRELLENGDAADREKARQLRLMNTADVGSTRERKTLLDTESLSEHLNDEETSEERPRKAYKVLDSRHIMTVPSWVMRNRNDLYDCLSRETDRILEETKCSVTICRNIVKDGILRITIGTDENCRVRKARDMIQGSIIEFMDDEGSNGRLLYELMTNLEGSINFDGVANGFVQQRYHGVMVWMKLLELPYFEFKGTYRAHGGFLQRDIVQSELKYGTTGCKVDVYGFGNKTPLLCDPYILISAVRKEEVNIVAERVTDKLLVHQGKCHMGCKFLS